MPHLNLPNLPVEILRKVFLLLSWEDRKQLYQVHSGIASTINTSIVFGKCDLSDYTEFMQLKLARCVLLSTLDSASFTQEKTIRSIKIAANAKAIKVGCCLSSNFISQIIKALKHPIDVFIQDRDSSKWKSEIIAARCMNITLNIQAQDGLLTQDTWKPHHPDPITDFVMYNPVEYEKCTQDVVQDLHIKEDTEEIVSDIGKRFVGCLIDFGFVKTYISSLDAFVHLGDAIDDCANTIKLKEKTVFAKIREKANFKNSSYEVSVYIGSLELLAVGGVVFYEDKRECFLGSSVKPLIPLMSHGRNVVSRTIYTKKAPCEVINSERLLRQYYKAHSSKLWSFHSKNLFNLGFFPLNPLRVKCHPLIKNTDASLICHSAIFLAYASRSFNVEIEFSNILGLFKSLNAIKKKNLCDLNNVKRFREISKKIPTNNKWWLVAETLAAIDEQQPELFANNRRTKVKNKKLLLDLGNSGFFADVARKNSKIIKVTEVLFLKL